MQTDNIFERLRKTADAEVFEDIIRSGHVRIERILSEGQSPPESNWYDQDENEWVIVLQGCGKLVFHDGNEVELNAGDYINIPAHKKHRVSWTDPEQVTVWLAVFYK